MMNNHNYPLSTSFSPSCDCECFCIVAWTAVLTWKVQNKDEATRSSFFRIAQLKWCTVCTDMFIYCTIKILYMARTKLIITSFNTDTCTYHDLIALFSPPPRSLEVNMSESRVEGKNSSVQSSSTKSFPNDHSISSLSIWLRIQVTLTHVINNQLFLMINNNNKPK